MANRPFRFGAILRGARSKEEWVAKAQMIANVFLTRRSHQMVHLGRETYRDTSLVTCGEYQLFLDEQPAHQKPDHWQAPRFPHGQGNAPLLGIEQKQAKAFVTWLTKREQGPWQYRLPKAGELNEQEIAEMLPTGTGFWLEEDQGFCWVKQVPTLPVESLNKILGVVFPGKSRLDLQLNRVQKIIQSATRARRELKKSETVAAGPRDEANRWARILSRVEEEGKELISELKNALPSASSPNLPHARAIVLAFALAFCPEHKTQDDSYRQASSLIEKHVPKPIRARELSFRLGPYLAQSLVERLKQKERAQLMEEMLDMYLNLAILEGRIRDLFPTCEGIFLVKEQKYLSPFLTLFLSATLLHVATHCLPPIFLVRQPSEHRRDVMRHIQDNRKDHTARPVVRLLAILTTVAPFSHSPVHLAQWPKPLTGETLKTVGDCFPFGSRIGGATMRADSPDHCFLSPFLACSFPKNETSPQTVYVKILRQHKRFLIRCSFWRTCEKSVSC